MVLSVTHSGKIAVLEISGRLYADEEEQIEQTANGLIQKGYKNLIINMRGITSVNSRGLSSLITIKKKAKKEGGDTKLSQLSHTVRELMELTRLSAVFDIFDTDEEAMESFSSL